MAHFRAHSPASRYISKTRWAVGGLLSIIAILFAAITYLSFSSNSQGISVAMPQPAEASEVKFVDTLVAVQRIEEGNRVESHMLKPQPILAELVPASAVQAREISRISGLYAKRMIVPGMPISLDDFSSQPPISALTIPPGYRAKTIRVSQEDVADGFVVPGSRVDLHFKYIQHNKRRAIKKLVSFARVLVINGTSDSVERVNVGKQDATVTLLVTERDAMKIELASTQGSLSLSLLGREDIPSLTDVDGSIDFGDITEPPPAESEPATDGTMIISDPRTGCPVRYVLRSGRWNRDRSLECQASQTSQMS